MVIFSLMEVVDIVVMTLVIGFIFKDVFPRRPKVEVLLPDYDPLAARNKFKWGDFWFAVAVVAPSIILHEFGHKFAAMSYGFNATFHADYFWLGIALILKLLNFGFIFLVPAFVSFDGGGGSAFSLMLVSFAGPAVNLVLWLGAAFILNQEKKLFKRKKIKSELFHLLFLVKRINMFLFIFNMLPIPGFDGWSFFKYLFQVLF
jgi:Zn-dependent protease